MSVALEARDVKSRNSEAMRDRTEGTEAEENKSKFATVQSGEVSAFYTLLSSRHNLLHQS